MKLIAGTIICLLLICGVANAEEQIMHEQDVQKTWGDYHKKIKSRRLAEAKVINVELNENAITGETDLILDFGFFTQDETGAKGIRKQLSENYEMSISQDGGYWHIKGTSRPYAVNLTAEQHLRWVEFMHDVALSHGCIFSTWSITEPQGNHVWSNENIETEFD